jgi:general stress protein 26
MDMINYDILEEQFFKQLSNNKVIVLATCIENKVTARNMSCVMYNHKIYFQTDKLFLKTKQILENKCVALCVDNIQIEGDAKIIGHPDEEPEFSELYKRYFRTSYDTYSHLKNQIVIEVEPTFITLWKYADGHKPYRDFLDRTLHKAYREMYEIGD